MNFLEIKSNAKINFSLNIIKKLKNKFHKIESLISIIDLHDIIYIKKIKKHKHQVKFFGKFSKGIKNDNTVKKLLEILDKNKLLRGNKYLIKVKKNIPQKSGMGGGSMNAASILNYLFKRKIIKINSWKLKKIARLIGSDVEIGINNNTNVYKSNIYLIKKIKNTKLFLIIAIPKFGCSTTKVYKSTKLYSRSYLNMNINKKFKLLDLINLKNDLEKSAMSIYPSLNILKNNLQILPKVKFVRMTGSGSAYVAYFLSKKDATKAYKIFRKKHKNYWSIVSKTI